MDYDVKIENAVPHRIAVVRRLTSADQLSSVVPAACGEVWNFIRLNSIAHTGINACIYFDSLINMECGVLITQPFESSSEVFCKSTPGGLAASTAHFGPYHRLGSAHQAIMDWCRANGRALAGPSWEIYGHWTDDEATLRTDVSYLLA
jgi:effector-binding domain-containing protein